MSVTLSSSLLGSESGKSERAMPIRRRIDEFATDPDNGPQAVRSMEKDKNYAGFGGALAGFLSALNVPTMPSVLLPDTNAQ